MRMSLLLACALALASCKGCKSKSEQKPTQTTSNEERPRVPPATAPDPDYEKRRDELLKRGDPNMMKTAPVFDEHKDVTAATDLIKPVSKDVMMVGKIKVDLAAGTASFPATTALSQGMLEYVVVQTGGKSYESLLTTDVNVVELRLALTLLGYEGAQPDANGGVPAPSPGEQLTIGLEIGGKPATLSSVMLDRKTNKAPDDAPWQVVAFRDADRQYAVRTKELVTLVPRDPLAPLRRVGDAGNPYAGPDQGFAPNPKVLPKPGETVTIVIRRGAQK